MKKHLVTQINKIIETFKQKKPSESSPQETKPDQNLETEPIESNIQETIRKEPTQILNINDNKYVYFFGEGSKELTSFLGGKGAILNEMTNLGMPVPPGFTIATEVCKKFQQEKKIPNNIEAQISQGLSKLEQTTEKRLGDEQYPLFVSVRSGAAISMPGMMDTVLNIGLNDKTVETLAKKTGNEEFAYNSYKRLIEMFADVALELPLKETREYLSNPETIAENARTFLLEHSLKDTKNRTSLKKNITNKILESTTNSTTKNDRKKISADINSIEIMEDYETWKKEISKEMKKYDTLTIIEDPEEIKEKAKEGDKVMGKGECGNKVLEGLKGTIQNTGGYSFGIYWEKDMGGHNLSGSVPKGHGWNTFPQNLQLIRGTKIDFAKIVGEEEHKFILEKLNEKDLKLGIEILKDYIRSKGKEFPQEANKQLGLAINAVFNSWNNKRAIEYRQINNIPDNLGTAANIQAMVFGNMGDDSATGVAFSRRPTDGKNEIYGEYLPNAQGEDIVAGIRTPLPIKILEDKHPKIYKQLTSTVKKLETYFKDMQDIEFTIEKGKLWMLQAREGKRTALAAINIGVEMAKEGLISKEEAIMRIDPLSLETICTEMIDPNTNYTTLTKGGGASPGIASGVITLTSENAEKVRKEGKKIILIREYTNPNDLGGIAVSAGILTKTGGATSHAALVTRAMNKACVTGCNELEVYEDKIVINGKEFYEGETISIDGTTGEVIEGKVKVIKNDHNPNLETLTKWAYETSKTKFLIGADTPPDIRKSLQKGCEEISLCRTEHLFFMNGNIDLTRNYTITDGKEKKKILQKIRKEQEKAFKGILNVTGKNKIRIRLLAYPIDKFLPSETELKYIKKKRQVEETKVEPEKNELAANIESAVKINKNSEHFGQNNLWGRITQVNPNQDSKGRIWNEVEFMDGYTNNYSKEDLDILVTGDRIVINKEGDGYYTLSTSGSEGTIKDFLNSGRILIKFDKLTGGYHEIPAHFDILPFHFDIIKKNEPKKNLSKLAVEKIRMITESSEKEKKHNEEKMEERVRRPKKEVYDVQEMEEIYAMQTQAIAEAYSKTGSKAKVELLIPHFVPQNEKLKLQNKLQGILSEQDGITLNMNSESVYFVKNLKSLIEEKDRVQEAEVIALRQKYLRPASIIVAQYAIQKREEFKK